MFFENMSALTESDNGNGGFLVIGGALIAFVLILLLRKSPSKATPAGNPGRAKAAPPATSVLTAEDVVLKQFEPTKFREGYDQTEVDVFLDRAVRELQRRAAPFSEPAGMAGPLLTPDQVANQKFTPTKFREGYAQNEVDDFLDKLAMRLRQ